MDDLTKERMDWTQFEFKVREFYDKRAIEFTKLSAEFSKLLVTNLVIINAGGLVSIPPMNTLIYGAGGGHAGSYWPSVVCFIGGLLAALLCGFVTYRNYQHIAQTWDASGYSHIAQLREVHPAASYDDAFKDAALKMKTDNVTLQKTADNRTKRTYWLGLTFGWVSAGCFSFGAYRLITVAMAP